MDEFSYTESTNVEKRLHARHHSMTSLYIKSPSGRVRCKALNLSASGVAVRTSNMGLRVGSVVELSFVINLGAILRIHKRMATVKYVRNGITGFHMKPFEAVK